jgi:hypothetical protein
LVDIDGKTDRRMFGTLIFDDLDSVIMIPDLNNYDDFTNDPLQVIQDLTFEEVYFEDGTFGGKLSQAAPYMVTYRKWLDWSLPPVDDSGNRERFRESRAHGVNWRFIRYADVLLMYAEAVIMGDTQVTFSPIGSINIIRTRAKVPQLGSVSMTEIKAERILELSNEGHQGLDLFRWRTLAARMAFLEGSDPNFRITEKPVFTYSNR